MMQHRKESGPQGQGRFYERPCCQVHSLCWFTRDAHPGVGACSVGLLPDLILPRIFAEDRIERADIVGLGHGGCVKNVLFAVILFVRLAKGIRFRMEVIIA